MLGKDIGDGIFAQYYYKISVLSLVLFSCAMKNEPNLVLYNGEYDEEVEVTSMVDIRQENKDI